MYLVHSWIICLKQSFPLVCFTVKFSHFNKAWFVHSSQIPTHNNEKNYVYNFSIKLTNATFLYPLKTSKYFQYKLKVNKDNFYIPRGLFLKELIAILLIIFGEPDKIEFMNTADFHISSSTNSFNVQLSTFYNQYTGLHFQLWSLNHAKFSEHVTKFRAKMKITSKVSLWDFNYL